MKKKSILIYIGLTIILLMASTMIVEKGFMFGSKTDWINQHTIFPEYFRQVFYRTGKILPNFAPHLGAGQNIFNFSYYGLLNPIILVSYLFPNVEMTSYIMIINTILFIVSGLLLYTFLSKHTENKYVALLSTIILSFSASFLFHFHRHFMFVNYMPFLILGLIGIDAYFQKGKRILFTLSTFLIIMISYYYSIIAIVIFIIYGIYCYIQKQEKITIKNFLLDGIHFLIPIIIAILMASVLLLPTAYVILEGRGSKEKAFTLMELLLPKANINAVLYDTYSLGLTAISLIALLHLIMKKEKENRFLAGIILFIIICPSIIYILNGGLYIRNKIFIPFLPLIGISLIRFLEDVFKKEINIKRLSILVFTIAVIATLVTEKIYFLFFLLDATFMFLLLALYKKTNRKLLLVLPLLLVVLTNWFIGQKTDNYINKEFYKETFNKQQENDLNHYLDQEKYMVRSANLDNTLYTINKNIGKNHYTTSVYSSTFHKDYNSFQQNIFKNPLPNRNTLILAQSNNIMYQTLMGIKYISYSGKPSIGYEKLTNNKNANVYKNDNTIPIGYATSNIMNRKDLENLPYPQNEEALIGNIITEKEKTNFNFKNNSREIFPNYMQPTNTKNLKIEKKNDKYIIDAKQDTKISIPLNQTIHNQILFITFKIHNQTSCNLPTQRISINGTTNKISCQESEYQNHNNTFHYVLSKNEDWNNLAVTIGEGHYVLSDFKTYILDYGIIKKKVNSIDKWYPEYKENNAIEGNINVSEKGYFATTVPYDEGFKIYVDGKETNFEKVNTAFIGFKVEKGRHHIKMVYHSPLLKEGIIISIIGLCGFISLIILDYRKRI